MNIAILGYGVVGKGCAESLKNTEIKVSRILDIRPNPAIDTIRTENIEDIINDKSIDLVAELMGGEHPAYEYVKAALQAGKHAVTSNKQMFSLHYDELIKIAKENKVKVLFSACVGGGIPWIRNLKRAASIDEIIQLGGVMNGTSNFILDSMMNKDKSFEDALKEAQELGYAEKDPTADIMGYDVRAKLAISSNVAFGTCLDPLSIKTEGITKITKDDIAKAKKQNQAIRLIASAKKDDKGNVITEIRPQFVGPEHPAFNLAGARNIFWYEGKNAGLISFSGMGAGGAPTGKNVAEDIMEALGL